MVSSENLLMTETGMAIALTALIIVLGILIIMITIIIAINSLKCPNCKKINTCKVIDETIIGRKNCSKIERMKRYNTRGECIGEYDQRVYGEKITYERTYKCKNCQHSYKKSYSKEVY